MRLLAVILFDANQYPCRSFGLPVNKKKAGHVARPSPTGRCHVITPTWRGELTEERVNDTQL